jgi:hypothetical protein
VRDAIAALHGEWMAVLARDARQAVADGDLPRETLPEDVAFSMNAIAMGVNQGRHLLRDADAPARGWRAFRTAAARPACAPPLVLTKSLRDTSTKDQARAVGRPPDRTY